MKSNQEFKTKKFIVAQLGARMHYAVPEIFQQNDLLKKFYTDLYFFNHHFFTPFRLNNNYLVKKFISRRSKVLYDNLVSHFLILGLLYYHKLKQAKNEIEKIAVYLEMGEKFNLKILKHLDFEFGGIYTFNTAGLGLMNSVGNNVYKVHEQTIAPFYIERQLLQNEEEKFPSWIIANKLNYDIPMVKEYISKELEELVISDRIYCASDFVKNSILSCHKKINADKIKIVPYGVDLVDNFNTIKIQKKPQSKIKVLTVGTVGIRKGHPYIIEAAKKLKDIAEFRIIGDYTMVPPRLISNVSKNVTFLGQIPRQDVAKNYQWADVFLLPSICEGSATATYEALVSGLPIIVTPNAGSVIENNKHGFIIPVSNTNAICNKIEELYNHPDKLNYFKENISQLKLFLSKEGYKNRFISNL